MINGVFDVTPRQFQQVKVKYTASRDSYLCEIDGRQIVDDTSFYVTIGTALGVSKDMLIPITNMNWFYDELTTLYWFEDASGDQKFQQYIVVFYHPDAIRTPPGWDLREFFQDVANFWINEVEHVVVGGQARGFAVYLVHEPQSDIEPPQQTIRPEGPRSAV